MPRRGESIYKRKDGRWEARYVKRINGDGKKEYGSVYAKTYREVKEKQRICLLQGMERPLQHRPILIQELTEYWLQHIQHQVKPASYQKYEGLCRNHILPKLGDVSVASVTSLTVDSFARECRAVGSTTGGPLSVKTVNDILILLGLILDFAAEEYHYHIPKITKLREEKQEARVLTPAEQCQLTEYLLQDTDSFKFAVLLTLYTGLRVGELCALQWTDITEEYLVVDKTLQRLKGADGKTKIIVDSPKTESSKRIVPIPGFLKAYISQFRQDEGYVLSAPKRDHSEPRAAQMKFQKISQLLGLENVTFHTLRHTFATRCVEAGFDVKTLSEILGHSDVKTTLNRYVHSSFETKKRNMEKLTMPVK